MKYINLIWHDYHQHPCIKTRACKTCITFTRPPLRDLGFNLHANFTDTKNRPKIPHHKRNAADDQEQGQSDVPAPCSLFFATVGEYPKWSLIGEFIHASLSLYWKLHFEISLPLIINIRISIPPIVNYRISLTLIINIGILLLPIINIKISLPPIINIRILVLQLLTLDCKRHESG